TATFGAARDLLGHGADEQRPWVADARRGAVLVHRLHELAFEGEDRVPAAGELFDLQLDRGSVQTVMGGETADDVAQFSGEATCLLEAPDRGGGRNCREIEIVHEVRIAELGTEVEAMRLQLVGALEVACAERGDPASVHRRGTEACVT